MGAYATLQRIVLVSVLLVSHAYENLLSRDINSLDIRHHISWSDKSLEELNLLRYLQLICRYYTAHVRACNTKHDEYRIFVGRILLPL